MGKLCIHVDTKNNTIDFDKEVEKFKQRLEDYIEDVGRYAAEDGKEGFEVLRGSHECDYALALHQLYRSAMDLGPNHPKVYLRYIKYACEQATRPHYCKAEGCVNKNRYDSGYCGIHDIEFNNGKGQRYE